jgi:hexosaminidase
MIKKSILFCCCFLALVNSFAQSDENMGIIPAPVAVVKNNGSFVLDNTVVLVNEDLSNAKTADLLHAYFLDQMGMDLKSEKALKGNQKAIVLSSKGADNLPSEGYIISIATHQIKITGKNAGLFYALQTLMQLMPAKTQKQISLQNAVITDYPRFKYRGMHLDVGRHFFPISFVKKYIDVMAAYKLNNFHWHLTEDQGWRIEIKKYPKLTSIGATRGGTIIGNYPGTGGTDNEVYRGYYTQSEVKELVAYAAARFINVIPEIEMPGHSSAAIAAYPELSCFPERDTFISDKTPWSGSRQGKQVQQTWGVFDDVFVPSENTFKFLENVLDEVIALFPSKYIHIGGDECPKEYWKQSAFCQQLIKDNNLKDEHGLQSYFIQRIEKYLNSKGRSIIGWDEILEGGLAPNATVMSWRGEKGGIDAAKLSHDVIMTPGEGGLYFDHKQSNSPDEPLTIGGYAPYTKAYNYDPVPKELSDDEKKYVIGVQANVWTEYMETPEKVEYMIFPRIFALSEIAWSPQNRKNLVNFSQQRMPLHLAKLDQRGVNFWVPTPIGQTEKIISGENITIDLKVPMPGAKIYYTLDGYRPSENAHLYTKPLLINVAPNQKRVFKTIVISQSGKRSVVTETILSSPSLEPLKK